MKYRLTYQSESRLLTVDFLIYLQDEDIAGFKRHVKLKVKERRVDLLFIDFSNLEKKGLPPITRKGREALAGIAATYKPERIALVNVPALLSVITRAVVLLIRSKTNASYRFFNRRKEALAWLMQ